MYLYLHLVLVKLVLALPLTFFPLEQSSSGRVGSFVTFNVVDDMLMHYCDYTYLVGYLI